MSVPYLGDFAAGATVYVPWNTTAVAGGSITLATDGTLKIYRLPSPTQRTSAAGITFIEDYDTAGIGRHLVAIDLGDDADVGFYAAHGDFGVARDAMGIDGETVNAWIALFSIENRSALMSTVAGQTIDVAGGFVTAHLTAQAITDDWAAASRTLTAAGVSAIATAVAAELATALTAAAASHIKRNQALAKFPFQMTDATTHAPLPGLTGITCLRSIDGVLSVVGTLTNITEHPDADGTYLVDFGAGDLDGKVIKLKAVKAGCDLTQERIITVP